MCKIRAICYTVSINFCSTLLNNIKPMNSSTIVTPIEYSNILALKVPTPSIEYLNPSTTGANGLNNSRNLYFSGMNDTG